MILALMMPVAGCMNGASNSAICDGSQAARTAHAAALAAGGDDASVVTGAKLIGLLDAGCNDTKGRLK
jgi:hypothetical protein